MNSPIVVRVVPSAGLRGEAKRTASVSRLFWGIACITVAGQCADLKLVGNLGFTTVPRSTTAVFSADRVENRTVGGTSGTIQLELWAFSSRYTGAATPGFRMAAYSIGQLPGGNFLSGISSGNMTITLPPAGTWYVSLLLTEFTGTGTGTNNGFTNRDYGNITDPMNVGGAVTFTVTNGNDSGAGSLRQFISTALSGDTIEFAAGFSAVNLTSGELLIDKNLTINGPGPNVLAVQRSSGASFRIFHLGSAGVTASISGLKISDGATPLLPQSSGGGILNPGTLTITNCIVSGNRANPGLGGDIASGLGGGIASSGFLTVIDSTISGNVAAFSGGGLVIGGRATLINTTISDNATGSGTGGGTGGGIASNAILTVTNCTIAGNSAASNGVNGTGGGIYNTGTLTAKNTIIALNTSATGPDVGGRLTSDNFNLIGNNAGATITPAQPSDRMGTATSPLNPLLSPLQNNGGRTSTRALLAGSPAIDAGDNSVLGLPLSLATDQRGAGFPRRNGSQVDIGAFEFGAPAAASRLINLSVRTPAGTGGQTLIVGFVVGGAGGGGTLPILVRGTGPALTAFGVPGALNDPMLTLFSGNTVLNSNDNWGSNAAQIGNVGAAVGAFALTNPASLDAALYNSGIAAGSFSAQVTGNGAVGVALAEIYDAAPATGAGATRLINVSARSQVGTGGNILITGFVIAGTAPMKVLIRGIGASLSQFGVPGVLADPVLNLYNSPGAIVATNDNWGGGSQLSSTFAEVGAFPLSGTSTDAALFVTLQPGLYTAQVSGSNNTTGVALVEVYEVP